MPKKNPGERWRYIAFKVEGEDQPARNDFLNSIFQKAKGSSLGDRFRITVFEGDFGILKVPHFLKSDAIDVLESIDAVRGRPCRVVTLKTSGTIKTLKDKYLKERSE